jgi:Tfp pilus assembly protein PilN
MNNHSRPNLNLASHPVANRRLFFSLGFLLGVLFLIAMIAGGRIFVVYGSKAHDIKASLTKIDREENDIQSEEKQLSSQIEAFIKDHKNKVDLINNLIYRKSFSWVGFLSTLEKTLPGECYIVSLSPDFRGEKQVDFKLRMASPNLETLLKFIQNLDEQGFLRIRVSNEARAETGYFLYDMSVSYERDI